MNSSRNGDREQAAGSQPAGKNPRDKRETNQTNERSEETGGVTQITDEQDPIAAALRRVYNDAATEPLPEDLSELLSRLEAAEKDA